MTGTTTEAVQTGGADGIRDVIVVGSGPAGYTAALYTARAQLKPLLFGSSIFVGGSLTTTTEVENFPGFPDGVDGPDLMADMRAQAEKFGAEMIDDDIVAVDLTGDVKLLTDSAGTVHRARTVIIATGSGYRKLGVQGEDKLSGRGVSWCATCDGFFFRGKNVVVVGGGDTAMEEATFLTRFAETVTVVHRRSMLRASRTMQDRAFTNDKISFAFDTEVAALRENDRGMLAGLVLRDTFTGETREIPADGLFVAIGHDPRTELFKGQLELDAEGYIRTQAPSTRTSLPGVFAAGDVVDHTYRQAITAAGTGCAAALDAERHLAALADATTGQALEPAA